MSNYFSDIVDRSNIKPNQNSFVSQTAENEFVENTDFELHEEIKTGNNNAFENEKKAPNSNFLKDIGTKQATENANYFGRIIQNSYISNHSNIDVSNESEVTKVDNKNSKNVFENALKNTLSENFALTPNVEKSRDFADKDQINSTEKNLDRLDYHENALENIGLSNNKEANFNQIINPIEWPHLQQIEPMQSPEIAEIASPKLAQPKLVIGKISVEILPSPQATTKIINRIVQTPNVPSFPKANRLSFGLNQL